MQEVKIIMTWDIVPGRDQEYFEFVVREFAPGIKRLGIQPTQAWFTSFGNAPQIMMEGIAENYDTVQQIMGSDDWQGMHDRLLEFVSNYSQKIVRLLPRFQF